jgi:hypothetical protein
MSKKSRLAEMEAYLKARTCDDCGHVVGPNLFYFGPKEIRKRQVGDVWGWPIMEEYIYQPKYCRRCARGRGLIKPEKKGKKK